MDKLSKKELITLLERSEDRLRILTGQLPKHQKRAEIVQAHDRAFLQPATDTNLAFEDVLHTLALQARLVVGAHQSAISYIPGGNFKLAIHTHSFSEKYAKYNTYDVMPTGEGIWGKLIELNRPLLMTDKQLIEDPRFKNFSGMKDARGLEHPPMRGWLAAPLQTQKGECIGDFNEDDMGLLTHFARFASLSFELNFLKEHFASESAHERKRGEAIRNQIEEFNDLAVDREIKMVELKKEINELLGLQGKSPKYKT